MNPSLILLAKLRARGGWRKLLRTLRRPKGALLALFAVLFFALMLLPNLFLAGQKIPRIESLWFVEPAALFGFWVVFTITGRNTTAIAFSLPEVDFLFPGPFSRRELLVYKLALSTLTPLGTAVMMPIFLARFALWWPALALAVWLTFVFMQTTSLLVSLVVGWLRERFARWWIALAIVVVALVGVSAWQAEVFTPGVDLAARLTAFKSAWAVQAVLAPFEVFSNLALATTPTKLAGWTAAALAANLIVVMLVLWLDANFLEASLRASERRYQWIERAKRGGGMPAIGMRSKPRLGLPQFPRMAGAGAIAWRQALELLRNSTRLVFVLPAVVAMSAPAVFAGRQGLAASVLVMTFFIGFMVSTVMPLGLRTDLQHVEVFKSLPLTAPVIVWGSVASAVLYPTIIQIGAVTLVSAIAGQWPWASTLAVCFALPLNLLLVSADSVLVLAYPSTRRFVPGDLLVGMRMVFVYLVKAFFVMLAAAVASLYVLAVYVIVGESPLVMAVGGWVALMLEGAATVWLAALLFERFDPSLEQAGEQ